VYVRNYNDVQTKNPDGTETKKVEIIKDPVKVREYIRRKKASDKRAYVYVTCSTFTKLISLCSRFPALSMAEEEEINKARKEKRRLQEQLRRLKRNEERQRSYAQAMMNDDDLNSSSASVWHYVVL
jgi:hypothetical protein